MKSKDNLHRLIIKRRTIRLFKQNEVPLKVVKKAIDAARLAPSAANLQFLEYLVVRRVSDREKVFPLTRWAGYLYPRRTPSKDKRPTLYIIILVNKSKSKNFDLRDIGAAAQNIILSLSSYSVGSCWIGSVDKKTLKRKLRISDKYQVDSLIAAGYPAESPRLRTDPKNIKYWLDKNNRLHVPKRPLKEIMYLCEMSKFNNHSGKK